MDKTNELMCILSTSDWVQIASIVVNVGLTIWIVIILQNKLTNRRSLKDYVIEEIKGFRQEYRTFFNNLCSNKVQAQTVLAWFKLMNIKITDLMDIVDKQYNIDKNTLAPFQNELRDLITENEDFIRCFQSKSIEFSTTSQSSIIKFQQDNSHLFNKIIVLINEAK